MNAAIRIGRAIMQNESFFTFFGCTDDAVQVIIGPTRIGNPVSGKFRVDL